MARTELPDGPLVAKTADIWREGRGANCQHLVQHLVPHKPATFGKAIKHQMMQSKLYFKVSRLIPFKNCI